MSKASPTTLSRRRLEREGYAVALVERRIPGRFISVDLWNFGDLLACRPDRPGALIVQATTTSHQADRLAKALTMPELRTWLAAANGFEVWGWMKSKRSRRWEVTRRLVTLADLPLPDAPAGDAQGDTVGRVAPPNVDAPDAG